MKILFAALALFLLAACDQSASSKGDIAAPGERSVAVLPTFSNPPSVEVSELWREVARLLMNEPGIKVADLDAATAFRSDGDATRAAATLKTRFVLTTNVTGSYTAAVALRDGRTGAIVWGKTIDSDHDNVGALAGEVWVAALAAIKAARL